MNQTNSDQYAIDWCLPICVSWEGSEESFPDQMKLGNTGLNEVKMGSLYRTSQSLDYVSEHSTLQNRSLSSSCIVLLLLEF